MSRFHLTAAAPISFLSLTTPSRCDANQGHSQHTTLDCTATDWTGLDWTGLGRLWRSSTI
eukprot:7233450-Pyramimonas_sp.AAC.1